MTLRLLSPRDVIARYQPATPPMPPPMSSARTRFDIEYMAIAALSFAGHPQRTVLSVLQGGRGVACLSRVDGVKQGVRGCICLSRESPLRGDAAAKQPVRVTLRAVIYAPQIHDRRFVSTPTLPKRFTSRDLTGRSRSGECDGAAG